MDSCFPRRLSRKSERWPWRRKGRIAVPILTNMIVDSVNYCDFSPVMPATAASLPVEIIRGFNRYYTRKIGLLRKGLLDSPYSLTEVRVLFEIAHRPGITASALCDDLGLDAGYLSRMVARFVQKGLVRRKEHARDARQYHLQLTAEGRKSFTALNRRSSEEISRLVEHLPANGQRQLAASLQTARHLLATPDETRAEVRLREPQAGDWGWIISRHGALYAEEYSWDATFESLVARIVADFIDKFDPATERCWIAELEGCPVGCVFLVRESADVAKLRLLLVEPSARGHGIGRKLVAECVTFARQKGYKKIVLWTNSVLHAARRIYEQAGFKLERTERHNSFGHQLEGQTWELRLN
jgi:DNA-binding MarR family transcriptional regulator/GNAT superfamily N-acetyltransferase